MKSPFNHNKIATLMIGKCFPGPGHKKGRPEGRPDKMEAETMSGYVVYQSGKSRRR